MQKRIWQINIKLWLLPLAAVIVGASLVYTQFLAGQIAEQERKKVELWASAYKHLNLADETTELGFLFEVIRNNESVPVILTDENGEILAWRNLDSLKAVNRPDYLPNILASMQRSRPPIEIEMEEGEKKLIFYQESHLLNRLRYFPILQMTVIIVFLLVAWMAFNSSKQSEQNRLWVGMAKETAHQLGTPISSLLAWIELLRSELPKEIEKKIPVEEIEKDVVRLELVAERFSKIGSAPELKEENLALLLQTTIDYMQNRASGKVTISFDYSGEELNAMISAPLFEWVIENLLKNALDAIEGAGRIEILLRREGTNLVVDVSDSGKGMAKSQFKSVFEPGFSTKKRGWGLGLTLSKRIVEEYHNGRIFVHSSQPGKGATFRIILPAGV